MKHKVFFGIGIRIIILFTVAMFLTFIPEHLRDFFGDIIHDGPGRGNGLIDIKYSWGARHYWYFWMIFFLFVLALVNLIVSIITLIENNYDTDEQLK